MVILWWVLVWGLPLAVILSAGAMYKDDFQTTKFGAAFYVGIARTLYPTGIMILIFGCAHKQGCMFV